MIGIVGCGHVGGAMLQLFPNAAKYDKFLGIGTKDDINKCEIGFVCVPTPMNSDGSCDVSYVEEVLGWIETKVVVIRSTVPVGYTKRKRIETNKRIIFQPEYYGETHNHPFADLRNREWIVLGGEKEDLSVVARAYQKVYTSDVKIMKTDSDTAELAKYMENAYLAMKVTFCNEMYDIADAYNIDYETLREVWLMDPRIGRSHTFVYEDDRGFGGSCFPKDTNALIAIAKQKNIDCRLMEAVVDKNKLYRNDYR